MPPSISFRRLSRAFLCVIFASALSAVLVSCAMPENSEVTGCNAKPFNAPAAWEAAPGGNRPDLFQN